MKESVKTPPPPKNITLGDMLVFWKNRGTFNEELYRRISIMRSSQ
jgi:hypothetical protein